MKKGSIVRLKDELLDKGRLVVFDIQKVGSETYVFTKSLNGESENSYKKSELCLAFDSNIERLAPAKIGDKIYFSKNDASVVKLIKEENKYYKSEYEKYLSNDGLKEFPDVLKGKIIDFEMRLDGEYLYKYEKYDLLDEVYEFILEPLDEIEDIKRYELGATHTYHKDKSHFLVEKSRENLIKNFKFESFYGETSNQLVTPIFFNKHKKYHFDFIIKGLNDETSDDVKKDVTDNIEDVITKTKMISKFIFDESKNEGINRRLKSAEELLKDELFKFREKDVYRIDLITLDELKRVNEIFEEKIKDLGIYKDELEEEDFLER